MKSSGDDPCSKLTTTAQNSQPRQLNLFEGLGKNSLDGAEGIAKAWTELVSDHLVSGKQAHDAHLAAAMQVYGVQRILTFNGNDFKRYPGVTVLNPAEV